MLFAFVIVLFAGLAFMFLCLLRGQEKLAAAMREELAATRSRLEALERRLASRAEEPAAPETPRADAPLVLPGDSLIRAAGDDRPAPEPRSSAGREEELHLPEDRRDDADRPGQDHIPVDRLDMRPPSTPERDAGRARDSGMPELKL